MFFLIPIAVGLAGAAAAKGVLDIAESRDVVEDAQREHRRAATRVTAAAEVVDTRAALHGAALLAAHRDVVVPMAEWIESQAGRAGLSEAAFLDRIEVYVPPAAGGPRLAEHGVYLAAGAVTAVATAMAAPATITALVGMFGTASTGAAISSLSGAAATNATLAALGGGSLAAGGGGIAAGQALLGAAVPVVGLFMFGGTLMVAGSRALTDAVQYAAEVEREVAEMDARVELLGRVHDRIDEVGSVLERLVRRAVEQQRRLFAVGSFDPARDAALFAAALQLTRAVAQLTRTPILDPSTHELDAQMGTVLREARRMS